MLEVANLAIQQGVVLSTFFQLAFCNILHYLFYSPPHARIMHKIPERGNVKSFMKTGESVMKPQRATLDTMRLIFQSDSLRTHGVTGRKKNQKGF